MAAQMYHYITKKDPALRRWVHTLGTQFKFFQSQMMEETVQLLESDFQWVSLTGVHLMRVMMNDKEEESS